MTESIPEQGMTLLILVVDDEPDVELLFRQHFRRDLRQGRFTMEFAQSGDMALQRITDAAGVSLILILSDINMPGMTGLELLPKAKATRPDVPVIMITAYGDAEYPIEGFAVAGLDHPRHVDVLRIGRPLRKIESTKVCSVVNLRDARAKGKDGGPTQAPTRAKRLL